MLTMCQMVVTRVQARNKAGDQWLGNLRDKGLSGHPGVSGSSGFYTKAHKRHVQWAPFPFRDPGFLQPFLHSVLLVVLLGSRKATGFLQLLSPNHRAESKDSHCRKGDFEGESTVSISSAPSVTNVSLFH